MKIRDIHSIEKNNSIGISVFGYKNKEKHQIYVSKKCCEENHVDLLFIREEVKRHYALIKDVNLFIYDHALHRGKNIFCHYCLQAFSTEEILKRHLRTALKLMANKEL